MYNFTALESIDRNLKPDQELKAFLVIKTGTKWNQCFLLIFLRNYEISSILSTLLEKVLLEHVKRIPWRQNKVVGAEREVCNMK